MITVQRNLSMLLGGAVLLLLTIVSLIWIPAHGSELGVLSQTGISLAHPSGWANLFPNQVVEQNNVSARLTSLEVNKTEIAATICFDLPDTSDWWAYPRLEGQFVESSEGGLTNDDESTIQSTHRCYLYKFYNSKGFNIASGQELAIVIDALQTSLPEVITPEMVERANQRLASKGIRFAVEAQDHAIGFKILAKPENMSEETAYQLIQNALSEYFPGPWRFSVILP
jgi:hypothetical protein